MKLGFSVRIPFLYAFVFSHIKHAPETMTYVTYPGGDEYNEISFEGARINTL